MLLFTVECLLDRCGNDIDGYLVVSALGDDDVCIPFGRFDELQVHGFHGLAVIWSRNSLQVKMRMPSTMITSAGSTVTVSVCEREQVR